MCKDTIKGKKTFELKSKVILLNQLPCSSNVARTSEGTYNTPLEDDIAAVFVGEDGTPPGFTNSDVVHPHG